MAVGVMALAVAVTACGGDDDAAPATEATVDAATTVAVTEPATSPPATSEPDGATRTVEHALGTSEVPVDPQRIVVVDRRGSLAFVLELGLEPVGALDASWLFGEPFHPLIADLADAAGVEPIADVDGPNLEQVALLQPDVIIGNVRDMGEAADELAEIAPTVGLEWEFADPLQNAITIGDALGRGEEAQALVDEFDAALAAAAAESVDPGPVSIVGLFAADDIRIYREQNLYARLTLELGGSILPTEADLALDPEDTEVNFVSMEEIGLASGDRLISFVNGAAEADAAYRGIAAEPLVQALPGFQNDQVLEADPQLAFGAAGVTGITAMLDQLVTFYGS